jgi:Arc/MetJ family transcription regulator
MTKRLIDLDDDLLAAAQKELKTSGVSEPSASHCSTPQHRQLARARSHG